MRGRLFLLGPKGRSGFSVQKAGTAGVVIDHSKASGLVEVHDLIGPTFYRMRGGAGF